MRSVSPPPPPPSPSLSLCTCECVYCLIFYYHEVEEQQVPCPHDLPPPPPPPPKYVAIVLHLYLLYTVSHVLHGICIVMCYVASKKKKKSLKKEKEKRRRSKTKATHCNNALAILTRAVFTFLPLLLSRSLFEFFCVSCVYATAHVYCSVVVHVFNVMFAGLI